MAFLSIVGQETNKIFSVQPSSDIVPDPYIYHYIFQLDPINLNKEIFAFIGNTESHHEIKKKKLTKKVKLT